MLNVKCILEMTLLQTLLQHEWMPVHKLDHINSSAQAENVSA